MRVLIFTVFEEGVILEWASNRNNVNYVYLSLSTSQVILKMLFISLMFIIFILASQLLRTNRF